MSDKFNRLRMGLDLIQLDLKNARSRNHKRLNKQSPQSLAIQEQLSLLSVHLRDARRAIRHVQNTWKRVEKLEYNEKLTMRRRRNEGGQNMNLQGTYGK